MTEESKLTAGNSTLDSTESSKIAAALSSYARLLTFENRSRRNLYRLAGLANRTRDNVIAFLLVACVVISFCVPMLLSTMYFVFWASPGYVSEVRFVLRSSAPILSRDRYSTSTVEPKAKIVQDTAVLLNYLSSPAIVQDLAGKISFDEYFRSQRVDYFSKLSSDATQNDMLKYWKKHYAAYVSPKSGIVELEVIAYTPDQANNLLKIVLELAEQQVNKLSSGMWSDLRNSTQLDVDEAARSVSGLRGELRDIQNQTGVFDIDLSADRISSVLTTIESEIAALKSRRIALRESVSVTSPQISEIDRRLKGLEEQSGELRSQIAGVSANNLADFSAKFDHIRLELRLGEKKLEAAISDMEKIKLVSAMQLVYVDNFTEPSTPDEATYPKLFFQLSLRALVLGVICLILCGALTLIRKRLD